MEGGEETKQAEEAPKLVHGCIDATIFEADHLHHFFGGAILEVTEKIENVLHLDGLRPYSKIYATIDIGRARVARTSQVELHPKNPVWNEMFRIYCAHTASSVTVSVKNQLPIDSQVIGRAHIPVSRILTGVPLDGWFDLFDDEGHRHEKSQVRIHMKFTPVTSDPSWSAGVQPDFTGVPNVFLPLRTNSHVTLYQNAHLSSGFTPNVKLSSGELYRPQRYFEDLYNAIVQAKCFIYVAGWSVYTSITLIRDKDRMIPGAEGLTIGELLKKKADEGVRVLVMVWQDQTSISFLGNAGLMQTHDEETRKFFEGSSVKCFLCPRNPDSSLTAVQKVEIGTEFTHHQKTVTLDAAVAADGSARRIVSYIGGIDLSTGRYDDEHHTLFGDLNTVYKNDFQQNNFKHADLNHGGPREPWHDIHSQLEGLAAWDVLTNFEQRWIKQSPKDLSGYLLNVKEMPELFPPPLTLANNDDKSSWNVQVFRSIDDASVVGFPSNPSEACKLGLASGKDVTYDQSIHSAYIEAIRRAKKYIYIENQYFLGSCYSWKEDQDCGCLNLVPKEIALKIASKIKQGERFAVYVVTPMWPEGEPEGDTVQAILRWNRLTMEMMYNIVAKAIEEAGMAGQMEPTDYLNFFCLGNREVERSGEYVPPERPEQGTDYWNAQVNRRFLIYVHAKLMIVDDEYVIVGSANLNQRSLEGDRDTEIAHGSYQPAHLTATEGKARGIVHGFRMSLWYEHFIKHYPDLANKFMEPESLECVTEVRKIAHNIWEKFTGDEVVDLPGHLLPFPVRVNRNGELTELTEDGTFPDTKASIRGKSTPIPPLLTT